MLAIHFSGYASSAIDHFPDHLVSAILCVVFIVVSILGIAKTKWSKGRIIINTDGVDTTYIITFDEERKSAKVEKE